MAAIEGLLINYEWCSGCQSCELACRNEHEWNLATYGIKVLEMGPYDMPDKGGLVEWNYVPAVTSLCDLCETRVRRGEVPSCQLHCLAGVVESGSLEELTARAAALKAEGKSRIAVIVP
jgi:anaerobic dimethyl sulfoxide reductase subunit B (iron-sulfur subunit)